MKIAVFGRSATPENAQALQLLCKSLDQESITAYVYKPFLDLIKTHFDGQLCAYEVFTHFDAIRDEVSFLLSIGGDGTLLNTVDLVGDSKIPVVGINTGRLGFLAHFSVEGIPQMIHDIKSGHYASDYRSLLQVSSNKTLFGQTNWALNEFTIQKKDPSAVVKIHAYLNNEFLTSYWADGVIVSTPTGSTGYSLSSNGPIMVPASEVFVITPISPHNLNLRPIVLSDQSELSFKIGDSRGPCYCTLDSKYWEIDQDFEFHIKKANFAINIIRPEHTSYINTLRDKLMWGLDNRNK